MNYNEYIESIKPRSELREIAFEAAYEAALNQRRAYVKKKRLYLSVAACFALFALCAAAFRTLNSSKPYVMPTETTLTSTSTTKSNIIQTAPSETSKPSALTTKGNTSTETTRTQSTTEKTQKEKIMLFNDNGDEKCAFPLPMITFDGCAYSLIRNLKNSDLCKSCLHVTDNLVEMDKSDLGDRIMVINDKALIENEIDFSPLSKKEAEDSRLIGAQVYAYKKCANKTIVVVKNQDGYYLYHLIGVRKQHPISFFFDIFTASGNNPIASVEILHQDDDIQKSSGGKIVRNSQRIEELVKLICKDYQQINFDELCEKGFFDADKKEDYYVFDTLKFTFEDGTSFELNICKKYMHFSNIITAHDYGYFIYDEDAYKAIQAWINK